MNQKFIYHFFSFVFLVLHQLISMNVWGITDYDLLNMEAICLIAFRGIIQKESFPIFQTLAYQVFFFFAINNTVLQISLLLACQKTFSLLSFKAKIHLVHEITFFVLSQFFLAGGPLMFLLFHCHFSICLPSTLQEWTHFSPTPNPNGPIESGY